MRGIAEQQDDENHTDVHGKVDHRDKQLILDMGRMLDAHARPEMQVHGFAQYGECSTDKCLTRNDCRSLCHDDGKNQHALRHDGVERVDR